MNAKLLVLSTALAAAASVTASEPAIGEVGNESPAFVATDPMRGKAIIANPARGTLQVADLRNLQATPAALAGKNARAVVVNAVSGIAYVVDDTAPGWVVAVNIENGRVIRRTAVGNRPSHISADFPRGELYVSNRGHGSVSIVHAATLKVITVIPVGSEPGASSVDARRGLLYIVSAARRTVDVIDLESRQLAASVTVGTNPGAATVDEHSGKVYVNNIDDRTISVIEPASFEVVRTIPAGAGSTAGTLSSVHRRYYLPNADDNRVSVIDTQHDRIVGLVTVGRAPRAALLSATEDELYVLNRDDASASVVDTNSGSVTTTLAAGWSPRGAIAMSAQLLTVNDDNGATDGGLLATTPIPAAETALATEYVDATRQRYLHTAAGLEARLIADGLYGDQWRRTMRFFRVWTKQDLGRVPVCQFSNATDAEANRVFATPEECESLKANPAWIDEGVAYYVALPDAAGDCSVGTEPLYRLYNGSRDGFVAHRYVREKGVRDTMVNAGWIAEGEGAAAIFACVPALRPTVSPAEEIALSDVPEPFPRGLLPRPR
jgi:YVTN family beta-propeller protein